MKSTAYSAQSVSYSDMKSQFECCFVYNSLGPEQKCENISLLKIASLFPFVPAPESDKRERERERERGTDKICSLFPQFVIQQSTH